PRDLAVFGAVIVLLGIGGLALRAKVLEPYQVTSSSMLPTFEAGDRLVGRKVTYAPGGRLPAAGDIVAFRSAAVDVSRRETLPAVLLKRVIGLPGDHVEMSNGVPVVNGWTVPICNVGSYMYIVPDGSGALLQGMLTVEFLGDHSYLTVRGASMPGLDGEYVVQPGEVFVLGDNRTNSVDSRSYGGGRGGGVPLPAVEARVDRFLVGTDRSG
ncbi:MAG: signal peptidase I, partial [Polyangiaceae bacterium]